MTAGRSKLRDWTYAVPVIGLLLVALTISWHAPGVGYVLVGAALGACVIAAVHHAEAIARRVGEPYASLVLAVAVTIIEVALIVTLMTGGGTKAETLARDTVFAAVMITCNGIVGLSLLVGARRQGKAPFNPEGVGGALATIVTLATLSMVLPTFTTGNPGPEFTSPQLAFAAIASLGLYALFLVVQTYRHREDFMPPGDVSSGAPKYDEGHPGGSTWPNLFMLLVALVAVVGLGKAMTPTIESVVRQANLPPSFVGVIIALLVLAPETLAAVRAARRDQVQTSLNLAYGSAMASIGLTIPAIAVASIWLPGHLHLGLGPVQMVLLALTAVVGILTLVPGRATRLQAGVHLAIFAAFIFLAASP